MAPGLILCAMLVSAGIAFSLPRTATAFWPFTVTKADTNTAPILHDASLNLLEAPLNGDSTTSIDSRIVTTTDGSALISNGTADATASNSAATSPDTVSVPASGTISTYVVQSGDSLSTIAQQFGVTENTILWANNIAHPSLIKTGMKLVVLPVSGLQHKVRSGETLQSIAKKYSGDATDIAQFNGIAADGALSAGSMIIIPGGELPPTEVASSKSKTKKIAASSSTTKSSASTSSSDTGSGVVHYSNETGNPYKGGSGAALKSYFTNPVPGARLTQTIHGWNGVDLGAPTGTAIEAATDGTVILSRTGGWNGGYGSYVIIDNGSGIETLYAHMSVTKAEVGETVSAGEVIGAVGTSGEATGPHLHFEVRGAKNPFGHCTEMSFCNPE